MCTTKLLASNRLSINQRRSPTTITLPPAALTCLMCSSFAFSSSSSASMVACELDSILVQPRQDHPTALPFSRTRNLMKHSPSQLSEALRFLSRDLPPQLATLTAWSAPGAGRLHLPYCRCQRPNGTVRTVPPYSVCYAYGITWEKVGERPDLSIRS